MMRSGGGVATLERPSPVELGVSPRRSLVPNEAVFQRSFEILPDDLKEAGERLKQFHSPESLAQDMKSVGFVDNTPFDHRLEKYLRWQRGETVLFGSNTLSSKEMRMLGTDTPNLSAKQKGYLNAMRNGYATREDFLNAPASDQKSKEVIVFKGKNLEMYVTREGARGGSSVGWTNNGYYIYSGGRNVPPSEMKAMKRAWRDYANSPAGKRRFIASVMTGDGREQSRLKAYKNAGFTETDRFFVELDNRN